MVKAVICSDCFQDFGLRQEAYQHGSDNKQPCPKCKSKDGRKLTFDSLQLLAHDFFIGGSIQHATFGRFQVIESNPYHFGTECEFFLPKLRQDAALVGSILKVGFFLYGPPAWRFGEIYPLKKLNNKRQRRKIIQKILETYPSRSIGRKDVFYRLRKNLAHPDRHSEYDSAPENKSHARFNVDGSCVLYGSQDLEICLHECRAATSDELHVAILRPSENLKFLDLTYFELDTESMFDSLAMAVYYLVCAAEPSYHALTAIGTAAKEAGYSGIVFPSYFSRIKQGEIPNLGIFGRPIEEGRVVVEGINRIHMRDVTYSVAFGPVITT